MHVQALIGSIVQQTTVLIAQLATSAGLRAPLVQLAKQVFLSLSQELETQGVPRKVAADMFGLTLRSYQMKVLRLVSELDTHNPSMWENIFDELSDHQPISRQVLLQNYREGKLEQAKSILHDMVSANIVTKYSIDDSTHYQLNEIPRLVGDSDLNTLGWIIRMMLYREGPRTKLELERAVLASNIDIEQSLSLLLEQGELEYGKVGEEVYYRCSGHCLISQTDDSAWIAAVYDHYCTLVTSLCAKLQQMDKQTVKPSHIGGSTYSFDVWPGHPYEEEVLALLSKYRTEVSALRSSVTNYNLDQTYPKSQYLVNFYFGQSVLK